MKNNNVSIVALILLILGVVLTFYIGTIGIVLTVIAFILSLTQLKTKSVLNKVVLVLSIIMLCFDAVVIAIGIKVVNDTNNKVNKYVHELVEQRIVNLAETDVASKELSKELTLSDGETYVINAKDLMKLDNCEGYAIYTKGVNKAQAYLKCTDGYKTEGFNEKYLK